ncbi:MAG: sulfate adenylyltransferase [Ignavibacteria bacterium]|nr:sulfate adenylyltransferase [Ignavibacteria bacterium]
MDKLISPHGSSNIIELLLQGNELEEEIKEARKLLKIPITSREMGDLIMMGIGAYTPLKGFMGYDDWKSVCADMSLVSMNGLFWPIPITISVDKETASKIKIGDKIALFYEEQTNIVATLKVEEKYSYDKSYECLEVFKTTDQEHPGVKMVMEQGNINLGGKVKAIFQLNLPTEFSDIFYKPNDTRKIFAERGWKTVATYQTRNPMHRSQEYIAKVALEVSDGLYIQQLIGKYKPGDIPADITFKCINALMENYFVKEKVLHACFPLEMRYAGPREALLHAIIRQNYGATHIIIGRDYAGVGNYYSPFEAQDSFDELRDGALLCKPLKVDWTFYCYRCQGMASMKTCPHSREDRLLLSGTMLRKALTEGQTIPSEFSRPEVLSILREYYSGLDNSNPKA